MKPLTITMENFLSYTEEEVNLEGIHTAVLLGANGAGKSSLLDAITWALYGAGRGAAADDFVHQGSLNCRVQLIFELGNQLYRVVRHRSTRGRGKTTLDLAVQENGSWKPITESSVRETETKIKEILSMDYSTFASTCFILQGESDRFSQAGPTERKHILGEVLGLNIYQMLHSATKDKHRVLTETKAQLTNKITGLNYDPEQNKALAARLNDLNISIAKHRAAQQAAEDTLQELTQKSMELRLQEESKTALQAKTNQLKKELEAHQALLVELRAARVKAEYDLPSLERALYEKMKEKSELEKELKKAETELEQARSAQNTLTELKQKIKEHTHLLNKELAHQERLITKKKEAEQLLNNEDMIKTGAQKYKEACRQLTEIEEKSYTAITLAQHKNRLQREIDSWAGAKELKLELLEKQIKSEKEKARLLKEVDCTRTDCPLLQNAYHAAANQEQLKQEYEKAAALDLKTAEPELSAAWDKILTEIDELNYKRDHHDYTRKKKDELEKWDKLLYTLKESKQWLDGHKCELEESAEKIGHFTRNKEDEEAKLVEAAALTLNIKALEHNYNYHKNKHTRTSQECESLNKAVYGARQAEAELPALQEKYNQSCRDSAISEGELTRIEEQIKQVNNRLKELPNLENTIALKGGELKDLRHQENTLHQLAGQLKEALEQEQAKKIQAEELAAEISQLGAQIASYTTLAKAFGKDGIPALIIENTLPEIEREGNLLLTSLTAGRMTFKLISQKETKTTGGQVETLEILVLDELGVRPYSLWSGAERFCVDISVRLAISKVLARRAGARIETLVIDEGASCLDAAGRQKFIEAVRHISREFARVIVVTHIEELQEAFPQQISISKGSSGSRVEVKG